MFVTDQLCVRTKDNAELSILLRYKTRFQVDKNNIEKMFIVEDFIGYATETLAAIIRQEAAQHDFEEFHANAAQYIGEKIFTNERNYYRFEENGFEIFAIDIKKIIPEDKDIADQLSAAIKSNMDIYINKMQQFAQLEAERQLNEGRLEIEKSKKRLLELEQENYRAKTLGNAEIDAEARIKKAEGESEALRIVNQTQNTLELEKMNTSIDHLTQEGGEAYIRLQQVQSFRNVDKTIIVPTDSKLFVPIGNEKSSLTIMEEDD